MKRTTNETAAISLVEMSSTRTIGVVIRPSIFRLLSILRILSTFAALLSLCLLADTNAQRRRVQQQQQETQTNPLVRSFRGLGKSGDLPSTEKFEVGADQVGQILQGNNTLVRWSAHTPFVADRGYLIFRTGITSTSSLPSAVAGTSEINGLMGKARFTGFSSNEIEIGVKPEPNKLYLLDLSIRHQANCDRCKFSVSGPDGHSKGWSANTSESQHFYFTFITNDSDWYPLKFRGGSFEFEYCQVHEVKPL